MSKEEADITHPRYSSEPSKQTTSELGGPPLEADLVALTGDLAGRRYAIKNKLLIGRDAECNLPLPGDDVSRRHAMVWRTSADEFVIEDLKSRNGTLVNGVPIEVSVLRVGDKVQIGSMTLFVFTEHQSLEEQLVQWQRMELVSQMTAGMIHDFNNCMTVILGNIQTIQNQSESYVEDEDLRQRLTEMEVMAWEGVNLARKVLNFARGIDRARTRLDLSALIEDTLRLIRRSIPDNIKIELALQPELMVIGDRSDLMQVVINLILNARDAMPDGGKLNLMTSTDYLNEEQARAARLPLAGDVVVLKVKDNGIGMSEETRKRVFEPLFTTKAPGKGTGLGLSTVARIAESHNGCVKAESKLGKGSTFTVYLPVPPQGTDAMEERTTVLLDGRQASEALAHLGGGFVLLLHGEPVMRQRAANVILSVGCDVLHAGCLGEALELFSKYHERIRLVVMDIDPQSEQGADAFRRLTTVQPAVKVMVTAPAGGAVEGKKLAEGILTFLGTPCDTKTFREALCAALA